MPDEIEPALTPSEWTRAADNAEAENGGRQVMASMAWQVKRFGAVIALANSALPADDPRKITHAKLDGLRAAIASTSDPHAVYSRVGTEFLDALASYLPPE